MTKTILILSFFIAFGLLGQTEGLNPVVKKGIGFKQNAQKIRPNSFWMEWDSGVGVSFVEFDENARICLGTILSANWIDKQHRMVTLRGGYHRDQGLMAGFMGSASFEQEISEIGIQLGGTFLGEYTRTTILFGLAPVFGVGMGKAYGSSGSYWSGGPKGYMRNPFFSLGIPLTIKTAFCPGKFGFGVGLDANINPYMTYVTLKLNLIFGNIRK